jgi:hypothetical protein
MIGWIKSFTKKIAAPDVSAPRLLGPDRNPTVRDFNIAPFIKFYDPNSLDFSTIGYGPRPLPISPNGPQGPQNYNSDCARQPQTNWNRAGDGCMTMEFFRRLMMATGLEHV